MRMRPDLFRTLDLTSEPAASINPVAVLERIQPEHTRILMTEPQVSTLRRQAVATMPAAVHHEREAPRGAPAGTVGRIANAWLVQAVR